MLYILLSYLLIQFYRCRKNLEVRHPKCLKLNIIKQSNSVRFFIYLLSHPFVVNYLNLFRKYLRKWFGDMLKTERQQNKRDKNNR